MESTLFWSALGAIGGTLGACATTVAVIVALWQTKYSQKKKLKISFNKDIAAVSMNGEILARYIGISIANIGNRSVTVTKWGFELHNGESFLIVGDNEPISKLMQAELPHKIEIEEGIDLIYRKKYFLGLLKENVSKGNLDPKKSLRFYVFDNAKEKYYIKTPYNVAEMIQQIDQQIV